MFPMSPRMTIGEMPPIWILAETFLSGFYRRNAKSLKLRWSNLQIGTMKG